MTKLVTLLITVAHLCACGWCKHTSNLLRVM